MEIPSTVSDSISFEDAIEVTQSLLSEIDQGRVSEPELERIITALVQSENGARGFFVVSLTDDRTFMDHPSTAVIDGLRSSPNIAGELLVKNLAMSTAMILAHTRNQNPDMAEGSARVQRRVDRLIRELRSPEIADRLNRLKTTITTGQGDYQRFLDRWKYDAEQRQAIAAAVNRVVT